MPLIVAESATLPNTAISLGTLDSVIVFQGREIVGTGINGFGIGGTGSHQYATILGSVFGEFGGVALGTVTSIGQHVHIGVTGFVGGGAGGVRLLGGGATLTNEGSIASSIGLILGGNGDATEIINSGRIWGRDFAITRFGTTVNEIRILNTGTIGSHGEAYNASALTAVDQIVNRGTMIGDLVLGPGDDLYDGRGGRIEGTVFLGDGNDTVMPGDGVESYDGGAGVDTISFRTAGAVALALDDSFDPQGAAQGKTFTGFEVVEGSRAGADSVRGDGGNNTLWGFGRADELDGSWGSDTLIGGMGRDTLTGGPGNDQFRYMNPREGGDTIRDFANASGNNDVFGIRAAGFGGGLAVGTLPASRFQSRADNLAQDADDRFIFRTTDRTVWFDVDGNGTAAPVLIATLEGSASITHQDFLIF